MIAVGIGQRGASCSIEIWSYAYGTKIMNIPAHSNLIDSLLLIDNQNFKNSKIQFCSRLISIGRDKKLKFWSVFPSKSDDMY